MLTIQTGARRHRRRPRRVYPRVRAALRSWRDKYTADAGVVSIRETQPTWGHLSRYDREYIQETSS